MELTNPALPVLLAVAAAVLLVLLVAGWPPNASRRAAAAIRGVQAVTLNLLVVACCAAMVNNQYLFYVSWTDLLGPGQPTAQQLIRGAQNQGARLPLAPGVFQRPSNFPALPFPGQQEQRYTVHGSISGVTGTVLVLLPKGYTTHPLHRYPVLEMMTGYPGVPASAFRAFDLLGAWNDAVDRHAIAAPIVVIPQINTPDNAIDTECIDDPTGRLPRTETWLANDVPQWTAEHFPTSGARDHWATIGYSYGGWCAAMVSMRHPNTFGGAISIMGYFAPEFGGNYNPLKQDPALKQSYDLGRLARTRPPAMSMIVMASKDDPSSYPYMVRFLKQVRAPMSVTSLVLSSGGHNVDEIPPQLPRLMGWLSRSLAGFRYVG